MTGFVGASGNAEGVPAMSDVPAATGRIGRVTGAGTGKICIISADIQVFCLRISFLVHIVRDDSEVERLGRVAEHTVV